MLFCEESEFVNDINNDNHRLPLIWFVTNMEEIFSEFKQKEIEIADDLRNHTYGIKEFASIDINGYYIRVAERKSDSNWNNAEKNQQLTLDLRNARSSHFANPDTDGGKYSRRPQHNDNRHEKSNFTNLFPHSDIGFVQPSQQK